MTDEKWQVLIENAQKNFDNVRVYIEDLVVETSEGEVKQGSVDVLEFSNERGHFKIVRENKAIVLEKKMHFSHRQGDSARTEYVLSNTEKSHKIVAYIKDRYGDWKKL